MKPELAKAFAELGRAAYKYQFGIESDDVEFTVCRIPKRERNKMALTDSQIDNIFSYHAPHGSQQERYVHLREEAKRFAHLVNALCPESREKSIALTKIQEATQMANASIAINESAPVSEQARGL